MDKTINRLFIIFFLAFGLFISYVVLNKPLTKLTRASTDGKVSPQNSLVFAWPLQTAVNQPTSITIFARNYNGRAIPNKTVRVTSTFGKIQQSTVVTDAEGKAVFTLTADTPGVAEIEAIVDNIKIQRTISVQFE